MSESTEPTGPAETYTAAAKLCGDYGSYTPNMIASLFKRGEIKRMFRHRAKPIDIANGEIRRPANGIYFIAYTTTDGTHGTAKPIELKQAGKKRKHLPVIFETVSESGRVGYIKPSSAYSNRTDTAVIAHNLDDAADVGIDRETGGHLGRFQAVQIEWSHPGRGLPPTGYVKDIGTWNELGERPRPGESAENVMAVVTVSEGDNIKHYILEPRRLTGFEVDRGDNNRGAYASTCQVQLDAMDAPQEITPADFEDYMRTTHGTLNGVSDVYWVIGAREMIADYAADPNLLTYMDNRNDYSTEVAS